MEFGTSNSTDHFRGPAQKGPAGSVYERFESAWNSADSAERRPRIQDFLKTVPDTERSTLLSSLLALELKCRIKQGERPRLEDYLPHFPNESEVILSVFQQTGLSENDPTSS